MTTLNEAPAGELPVDRVAARWQRFEDWLGRRSDSLNPILVKEARQALRSRQFSLTFFVMLAAGWAWSFVGLALLGPTAYYSPSGPWMFTVYYFVLAAPLLIVIPYYAYSSLASEHADRTFEMVSITSLEASGILTGKLGASVLQMLIYLSALFPCLAFIYLLRGVDIFSLLLVVAYTCLLSIGLSMFGLLLATLCPSRKRYIIVGVLFAAALVVVFAVILQWVLFYLVIGLRMNLYSDTIWDRHLTVGLFYLNVLAILFFAARACLLAPSQNRSTALRIVLSVATLSVIVCTCRWYFLTGSTKYLGTTMFLSTWWLFAVGTIIVGEGHQISARVRRDLPKTALGRVLGTWYMPGPGTGYMFVLAHMLMLTLILPTLDSELGTNFKTLTAMTYQASQQPACGTLFQGGIAATCHLAIYLGLTRLILLVTRRADERQLPLRVLVGLLLVLLLGCGPWVLQLSMPGTRSMHYTPLQTLNPFWTLGEFFLENGPPTGMDTLLMSVLPMLALVVWVANLPSLFEELAQARVPAPARVIEEQQLAAAAARPTGPTNPWDQ